jgi:hypothetical protein
MMAILTGVRWNPFAKFSRNKKGPVSTQPQPIFWLERQMHSNNCDRYKAVVFQLCYVTEPSEQGVYNADALNCTQNRHMKILDPRAGGGLESLNFNQPFPD